MAEVVRAVVIHDHEACDPTQLNLVVGDVVYVLEQDGSGWWGGHKDEDDEITGWFPGICVEIQIGEPLICVADHSAGSPAQLDLAAGDVVYVSNKDDSGWWEGRKQGCGTRGLFPDSVVACMGSRVITCILAPVSCDVIVVQCVALSGVVVATVHVAIGCWRDWTWLRDEVALKLQCPKVLLRLLLPDGTAPRGHDLISHDEVCNALPKSRRGVIILTDVDNPDILLGDIVHIMAQHESGYWRICKDGDRDVRFLHVGCVSACLDNAEVDAPLLSPVITEAYAVGKDRLQGQSPRPVATEPAPRLRDHTVDVRRLIAMFDVNHKGAKCEERLKGQAPRLAEPKLASLSAGVDVRRLIAMFDA